MSLIVLSIATIAHAIISAEDAALVNETWKYRTSDDDTMVSINHYMIAIDQVEFEIYSETTTPLSSSLLQMRSMIAQHPSVGIRAVTSQSSELVCWCLSYDESALGMLYTLEVSRVI